MQTVIGCLIAGAFAWLVGMQIGGEGWVGDDARGAGGFWGEGVKGRRAAWWVERVAIDYGASAVNWEWGV